MMMMVMTHKQKVGGASEARGAVVVAALFLHERARAPHTLVEIPLYLRARLGGPASALQ